MLRLSLMASVLAGCAGGDDGALLSQLDGSWAGIVTVTPVDYASTAVFVWDDAQQLISGTIDVTEPDALHSYAIRRWSVTNDIIGLELTDVTDGTRGLRVNGTMGATFDGDATLRYPCDAGTCGYAGLMSLTKGEATLNTPTVSDTGS